MSNRHLVESYFAACSSGGVDEIARHFCEDAVVYDVNHQPVSTAQGIGQFYVKVRSRWHGATWHVDTYTEDAGTAAVEWTMTGSASDAPFAVRGSEHYEFRDGAIAQIRQYWRFDPDSPGSALRGYPYAADARFTTTEEDARAT